MLQSASILAQRYLDGEMNDAERAAFLDDVARDPRMADVLEQEFRLDMAIVDDAYAITLPPDLRATILAATQGTRTVPKAAGRHVMRLLFLAWTFFVAMTAETIDGATAYHVRHIDNTTTLPTEDVVVPAKTGHREHPSVHQPAEVEITSTIQTAPIIVDEAQTIPQFVQEFSSAPAVAISVDAPMEHQPASIDAVVSAQSLGIRYALSTTSNVLLFAEAGATQAFMQRPGSVNGMAVMIASNSIVPYLSVGVRAPLIVASWVDRPIVGTFSVGVASSGPLAIAELSMPVFDLSSLGIDIGIRTMLTSDVGGPGTVTSTFSPMLNIRYAVGGP